MADQGAGVQAAWLGGGAALAHVGIHVRDLTSAIAAYSAKFGIGPWQFAEPDNRGSSTGVAAYDETAQRLAVTSLAGLPRIELIEHLEGDQSPRGIDHVDHLGMFPTDYEGAIERLSQNFMCLSRADDWGLSQDGRMALFDTRAVLYGLNLEVIQLPSSGWLGQKQATLRGTPAAHTGHLQWLDGGSMFAQLGFIVSDMASALAMFTQLLSIGPWYVFRLGADQRRGIFRGSPREFDIHFAVSPPGMHPQLEVITPVAGDSMHSRFLAEHGDGLHHVGMFPVDFDQSFRILQSAGFECIQRSIGYGQTHDGCNAYFETQSVLHGLVFELIKVPTRRWDPVEIWPVDGPAVVTAEADRPWPRE